MAAIDVTAAAIGDQRDAGATSPIAAVAIRTPPEMAAATRRWPPSGGVAAATRRPGHGHRGGGGRYRPAADVRWVLDPHDDHRCVRALLGLHDLAAGVATCAAAPGSSWPVLVRDLLLALGKDRRALTGAGGRSRLPELLTVWLRAEQVRHLVVLRAHLLPPELLAKLEQLATRAEIAVWAVAHTGAPVPGAVHWTTAVTLLSAASTTASQGEPGVAERYSAAREIARRAGRSWRLYTERTLVRPRWVRPNCTLGTLLQNLTIDAHDGDDLLLRLHAARAGMRDEGLELTLPDLEHDTRLLHYLGPRFTADTVARLRRVTCPLAAGALTLALATDNNAPWLAKTRFTWTDPQARHVRAYTGTFRIPPQARPMLRALLLDRASRLDPPPALFVGQDGAALLGRRIAHRVRAAADLAGLRPGMADLAREKCYTPETFATGFTGAASIRSITEPTRPRASSRQTR